MLTFRVTLYDLFRYFLPGTVFPGAILILFWALFLTEVPLQRIPLHPEILGLAFVLAYVGIETSSHTACMPSAAESIEQIIQSMLQLAIAFERQGCLPRPVH
jgi:hypothetical protein